MRKPILLTIATCFAIVGLAGCNRGQDTTCADFLKMSASQRHDVIKKMGFAPKYTTNAKQVAAALKSCKDQPADETLESALGP